MLKKFAALLLALCMMICLSACNNEETSSDISSDVSQTQSTDSQTEESSEANTTTGTNSQTSENTDKEENSSISQPTSTTNSNTSSTSKPSSSTTTPSTSIPSTPSTSTVQQPKFQEHYAQLLIQHYESGSEITLKQKMAFVSERLINKYGTNTIQQNKLLNTLQLCFDFDVTMAKEFQKSEYYDTSNGMCKLTDDRYSNTYHNTYVDAYEALGNDEYNIYIKYAYWNMDEMSYDNISYWKAKVKIVDNSSNSYDIGEKLKYYTFEKISAVPSNAIKTNNVDRLY